ncbi:unnamed protein product [Penicillium bialowiezense]
MSQLPDDPFTQEVQQLRADYMEKRERSNLGSGGGRQIIDIDVEEINDVLHSTYWYANQCIRLACIPGTLSGDILSLNQDLPASVESGNYEIIGDQILPLHNVPPLPDIEDDSEDLDTMLALLPLVEVDLSKHFVKKGKYKSEICNLLQCQGGSCPGVPKSPHIIQLLGKSQAGELVFDNLKNRAYLDSGWSEKSDIYDLGHLIEGMVYGNAPFTHAVEWPVPLPLSVVVEACKRDRPEERPSLDEIHAMVEKL